jgi:hypothetical protein
MREIAMKHLAADGSLATSDDEFHESSEHSSVSDWSDWSGDEGYLKGYFEGKFGEVTYDTLLHGELPG